MITQSQFSRLNASIDSAIVNLGDLWSSDDDCVLDCCDLADELVAIRAEATQYGATHLVAKLDSRKKALIEVNPAGDYYARDAIALLESLKNDLQNEDFEDFVSEMPVRVSSFDALTGEVVS